MKVFDEKAAAAVVVADGAVGVAAERCSWQQQLQPLLLPEMQPDWTVARIVEASVVACFDPNRMSCSKTGVDVVAGTVVA